jgi:hypothetical protein
MASSGQPTGAGTCDLVAGADALDHAAHVAVVDVPTRKIESCILVGKRSTPVRASSATWRPHSSRSRTWLAPRPMRRARSLDLSMHECWTFAGLRVHFDHSSNAWTSAYEDQH